jgi:hypothetical protein
MAKHYELVKTVAKVVNGWFKVSVPLKTVGSSLEAFQAELVQDGIIAESDIMAIFHSGLDLFLRAKKTGKIRAAIVMAKEGKVTKSLEDSVLNTIITENASNQAELVRKVTEFNADKKAYCRKYHAIQAVTSEVKDKEEAAIIKTAYRAKVNKAYGELPEDTEDSENAEKTE